MKINKNPFRIIKDFFSNKFEQVEKEIENEVKELNKIEDNLDDVKDKSELFNKKVSEFGGCSDRKMIKFWLF
jgi:hypothetical protein